MRWIVLIASVLIQLSLGGIYAWSVFVPMLREEYGYSTGQTQWVFGLSIIAFATLMGIAGRMLDRFGPKPVVALGGLLYGSGYFLASLAPETLAYLLLGIGLITGAGVGFAYVCPLAVCVRWFPERKGLVTGVSVAGFGGGAIVLSALIEHLALSGMHVGEIFRIVAFVFGGLVILASLLIRNPPNVKTGKHHEVKHIEGLMQNPKFRGLCVGMMAGTFAGLMIIGNLKPIGLWLGIGEHGATTGVSIFAIGNALGRIAWGKAFDRIGPRSCAMALFCLSAAALCFQPWHTNLLIYYFACIVVGACFGASFVLYASCVATFFGIEQISRIYPKIFLAYALAALLGPAFGGICADLTGSYAPSLMAAIALCIAGGVMFNRLIASGQKDSANDEGILLEEANSQADSP